MPNIKAEIFIPWVLPGKNEIVAASKILVGKNKKKYSKYNEFKRKWTNHIAWVFKMEHIPKFKNVRLEFLWKEPNRRRDPSNVRHGDAFILDGMVEAGVIKNDTQRYVKGFKDEFCVDKENPGVWIYIIGEEDD